MMTIYKYDIAPVVKLPLGAAILKVGVDFRKAGPVLALWAMVDPKAKLEKRTFATVKTGESMPGEMADCFHLETIVWHDPAAGKSQVAHVFEVPAHIAKNMS